MNKSEIKYWLYGLLGADLLSFLLHYEKDWQPVVFTALLIVFLIISLADLELAVLVSLAELFVGSKGYLFSINYGGIEIPFRLAIFLVLISVSFWSFIRQDQSSRQSFIVEARPILLLGFIAVFAFVRGLIRGYGFAQVFFDANAYFFLAMFLPFFLAAKRAAFIERALALLIYCALYLSLKTLFILYFFTHRFPYFSPDLYQWIRDSGVGEITWTTTGAYRIFIQSQIYILVAWWLMLLRLELYNGWLKFLSAMLVLSLFTATLIISFSRSFWLGIVLSLSIFLIWELFQRQFKELGWLLAISLTGIASGFIIVLAVLNFPYPPATAEGLDIEERFQLIAEEAVSSRWNLLPPLWTAIKQNAIVGAGFGATVTYVSNDPRVRALSPTGRYTTSSFEWGYLDIWLKIGLIGLAVYAWIIWKIILNAFKNRLLDRSIARLGPIFGLLAVLSVHIGSPYLNHPLGLGLVLFLYSWYAHRSFEGQLCNKYIWRDTTS